MWSRQHSLACLLITPGIRLHAYIPQFDSPIVLMLQNKTAVLTPMAQPFSCVPQSRRPHVPVRCVMSELDDMHPYVRSLAPKHHSIINSYILNNNTYVQKLTFKRCFSLHLSMPA